MEKENGGRFEVSNLWSSEKDFGYDFGSIMQGMDEEDLERLLQLHLQIVSVFLMFSLIYVWPISFNFVYYCICLSIMDDFGLK